MKRPDIEALRRSRILDTKSNNVRDQACDYIEWLERLLEDLTPGGSEFHQNPQFCATFVSDRLRSRAPAALKKRIAGAEAQRDRWWNLLCETSDILGGPTPEKAPHVPNHVRAMTARMGLLEHHLRGFGFDVDSISR